MKWILYLLFTHNALAYVALMDVYPDQTKGFLEHRLNSSKTPFEKWRSFPKAYHFILRDLPKSPKARMGFCAGDPHLENFGFFPAPVPLFTLNDFDDSQPCSLDDDLLRFIIGSKMISTLSTEQFLKAYTASTWPQPEILSGLKRKSLQKGKELPKKYKKLLKKKICAGDFEAATVKGVKADLICARTKLTGGSAGLKRFLVLKGSQGFELKPVESPENTKRAVDLFLGPDFARDFFPTKLEGRDYLRRPLWAGVRAVELKDLSASAIGEVLLYETHLLGALHRKSNSAALTLSAKELDTRGEEILKAWNSVMSHGLVLGNEIKGR